MSLLSKKINRIRRSRSFNEIAPDEVLLDSSNLPNFDTDQFEGRLENPISRISIYSIGTIMVMAIFIFIFQAVKLQIVQGGEYRERSEKNLLRPVPLFAGRGAIFDRQGKELAWNAPGEADISRRMYATSSGLAHVLGYVQYPTKDSNGFYYREDFEGVTGIEKYFDSILKGENGSRLVEVDARGKIISENIMRSPKQGLNVTLSIDERIQTSLHKNIKDVAERVGFSGGAGVMMDIHTGEMIAITSYPEFSSQIMSDKTDVTSVRSLLNDPRLPFLDRAVKGLYTPGSIIKPYVALGALNEGIIDAETVIMTTGSISIPNPYDKTKSTVFRDWKNHGPVDMRRAVAVSSDVYFYTIGGGYNEQKGIGIINIDNYLKLFGLGTAIHDDVLGGVAGTIPTPEWKMKTFGEDWYLGDTYNTSIGQYGFQVTPVQIVRAMGALANGGLLMNPTIIKNDARLVDTEINLPANYLKIVNEGMRMSVTDGTSVALNVPYVKIAAKSGTAELGVAKDKVNSWITGFFPYENPKYAFAVILEKGSVHNLIGAAAAIRQQLDWMSVNTPEYFKVR